MALRVCVAGATGWAGGALARAIARADDLELVAGVSRRHAGRRLGDVLGVPALTAPLSASADEALATACDVFVEYTAPEAAKAHVAAALRRGVHVVIGTSGLLERDFDEIDALARAHRTGALAVGNFSLADAVLQRCAELAAGRLPHWEVVDYAASGKLDAPSGTARELAHRLSRLGPRPPAVPIADTHGAPESRGATLQGTQVHAVRLPGYVISVEVLFGVGDERLSFRYDAGSSPDAYVDGALLAIRKVGGITGLRRGLDSVLEV